MGRKRCFGPLSDTGSVSSRWRSVNTLPAPQPWQEPERDVLRSPDYSRYGPIVPEVDWYRFASE